MKTGAGCGVRGTAALLVVLLCALPDTAVAQKTGPGIGPATGPSAARPQAEARSRTRRYVTLAGFATTFQNPFLREPGPDGIAGSELQTRQEASIKGARLGVGLMGERFGGEIALGVWSTATLHDFDYFNPESSPDTTHYADASVGLIQFDLVLLAAPIRRVPLYAYAVLGMGVGRKRYTVSGHSFNEFNGPRELNEFTYTPGLGVRLAPIRFVSLFAEMRWVPGDASTTVPQEGCYIYVSRFGPAAAAGAGGARGTRIESCKTNTDFGHLLSAGVTISFP